MLGTPITYAPQPKRNIAMLTWIRGFAAIIVVVSHIVQGAWVPYGAESFDYQQHLPAWLTFFSMGNFGVTLFFALSGCTLYLGYHRLHNAGSVWSFYLRRFARIYPAFIVALFCYWAFRGVFQLHYVAPQGHWVEKQFLADFDLIQLLQYFTLTFNFRMESAIFNNAFWSLPVEFQFYLLFPLLLALHRRLQVVSIIAVCGVAYVLSLLLKLEEFHTLEMVWQFGGGMLCGHLFLRKPVNIDWRYGLLLLFALHLVACIVQYLPAPQFPGIYVGTYLGVIAVLMVYVCVNMNLPEFDNPVARFLNWQGEISYSIYLFHNLFVGAWLILALQWAITGWERLAFIGIGTLACTFLVSQLSYRWVEKPGMDAGKRLTANMGRTAKTERKIALDGSGNSR